jgi:hypothetical protein
MHGHYSSLEDLLNGDPEKVLTERRYTSNSELGVSTEFRSADRMQRIEELNARMDEMLRDLELYALED